MIALSVLCSFGESLKVLLLLFVSITNIAKIHKGYNSYSEKLAANQNATKEIKPVFHLSKTGKNVFYLYIDRAQARYIEPLFEECPELYEEFSGFTFYNNCLSMNGHTLLGSPPCYGGYEYTPEAMNARKDEKLKDKTNEALLLLPRIFTEQGKDFSATVTDPSWANYSWIPDLSIYKDYPKINSCNTDAVYTDLWYKEHQDTAKLDVVSTSLKRNILWYSLFRTSPLVLRPAFYNDGNYWSTNKAADDYNDYIDGYSVLDYLPRFTAFDAESKNTYTNLVNNTTHDGLMLQAPEYRPATEITNYGTSEYAKERDYHSMAGAIKRIGEWLDYLKENDCYDNTRIVIVADHGAARHEKGYEWDEKFEQIGPGKYHPLLMFKDFSSKGRLNINNDFMTNADGPSLLLSGIIENPVNPFTGKKIDSSEKEKGVLVCTSNIFMPYHNSGEYVHDTKASDWWRVKGNIFTSDSWTQEIQE